MPYVLFDLFVDLIEAALREFGREQCPYCERYFDKNVSRQDIEKWLRELREGVK